MNNVSYLLNTKDVDKMSYKERLLIYNSRPDEYNKLTGRPISEKKGGDDHDSKTEKVLL